MRQLHKPVMLFWISYAVLVPTSQEGYSGTIKGTQKDCKNFQRYEAMAEKANQNKSKPAKFIRLLQPEEKKVEFHDIYKNNRETV